MPAVDPVILQLRADVTKYRNELRSTTILVDQSLARQEAAARRLEAAMSRSFGRIGETIKNVVGSLGGAVLARQFLAIADASKSIDAQLRLATSSFGTFAQAQEDAQRIASETRNGLTETASLYGNLIRATQSLGGTQAQAARATETFSKALKIGGADTNAAAAATLQFGQALASGVLRGDEFNSIAEASPRILQLLADAMGKPRGELRALAEDGKLTADVLFRALTDRKFTGGIDAEFKTLPVTFGEAMQSVQNAAVVTIGAFDRGGQFSTALANFVTDGADGFEGLGDKAEEFGAETRAVIEGLANVFDPLEARGNAVFDALGIRIYGVREQIQSLLDSYDRVANFDANIENAVKRTANEAIRRAGGTQFFQETPLSNKGGRFRQGSRLSDAQTRVERATRRLEGQGYVVPRNADGTINEAGIRRKPAPPPPPKPSTPAEKKKGLKGPSAETLAKREEATRLRGLRDDEAFENEKAALNRDLLRARAATTTAAEQIAAFELQEIENARTRDNDSYARDVLEKRLTQARADELIALNDKVAAERASAVRLREQERQRQDAVDIAQGDRENQRDLLQAQRSLADTAAERRDLALRLLSLEYDLERAQLEAVVASRDATEAQKEIARRRLAMLGTLQAADTAAVERDNEGPLARYRRGMNDPRDQVEQAVADKLQAVNDGITDAISDKLGVKDPFLKQLLSLFIQQNIMKPLYDAMSGGSQGGGLGGILRSVGSAIGIGGGRVPGFASGGSMVLGGRGGVDRNLLSLNGAPIARVGRGEVMSISPNARATRGGGNTTVHQHFTLDARYGITTPELLAGVQSYVDGKAAQAVNTSTALSRKGMPAAQARFGSLGTTG